MSGPAPEQTVAEVAQQGIADQSWQWLQAHWADIGAGIPAIVLTLAAVEFVKGPAKLYLAHRLGDHYTDQVEDMAVRLLTLPCAFVWVATLDFTTAWTRLTGQRLDWWQGMLVGTFMTSAIAIAIVWAVDYLDVARTLRVRFRRASGVTREDIRNASSTAFNTLSDLNPDKEEGE